MNGLYSRTTAPRAEHQKPGPGNHGAWKQSAPVMCAERFRPPWRPDPMQKRPGKCWFTWRASQVMPTCTRCLAERSEIRKVLVVMVSGDRGLAGAYNVNILRQTLNHFAQCTGAGELCGGWSQRPRSAAAAAEEM